MVSERMQFKIIKNPQKSNFIESFIKHARKNFYVWIKKTPREIGALEINCVS